MKLKTWKFILGYGAWLLGLALLLFMMQSYYVFLDVLGGNLMMLLFAFLFSGGCLYFLKFFKGKSYGWILFLVVGYVLSYLLIEGLAMLFFVTLDQEMIAAIHLSRYYPQDVLKNLWASLPRMFWELITLTHVSHFLDVLYIVLLEFGFLSPLLLFFPKKDCQAEKKCV